MTPHLWTKEEADNYLATRVDHRTLPVVRDHRTPPVVRDHRTPPVVRDHRTRPTGSK